MSERLPLHGSLDPWGTAYRRFMDERAARLRRQQRRDAVTMNLFVVFATMVQARMLGLLYEWDFVPLWLDPVVKILLVGTIAALVYSTIALVAAALVYRGCSDYVTEQKALLKANEARWRGRSTDPETHP